MLLISEPKPKPELIDMHGRILAGENKGELRVALSQEVDDEFWEENERRREMSKLCVPDFMSAVRMPHIIAHDLQQRFGVDPYAHYSTPEARLEQARAVIWCLRRMGEERCITTVHNI